MSEDINDALTIVRGINDKPVATQALLDYFEEKSAGYRGTLFVGYPIFNTSEGKFTVDALLISPDKGIVVFDLIEGNNEEGLETRQDDAANSIEARLKNHRDLTSGRNLLLTISTISFGINAEMRIDNHYRVANPATMNEVIDSIKIGHIENNIYRLGLSAIQSISSIRKGLSRRKVEKDHSKGAKLKRLEESIATLDNLQSNAVIQTVKGVQRIRGLAGSGKTIVLALKAAYLHSQHPEWKIAVTFNTRSLKAQFKRLIERFLIEKGWEPDWSNLKILNAWGAPGDPERDGIYHQFCQAHDVKYLDYGSAKSIFGSGNRSFRGVSKRAVAEAEVSLKLYDVILVDEAQDFPPEFLNLCYEMLDDNKRLVYAYDELQNLSGSSLPPPEEIFGDNDNGRPRVSFDDVDGDNSHRDIILRKCYRNSRPVLVTAHSLGFGIYRATPEGFTTGLVQIFESPFLWGDIGYSIKSGELEEDRSVTLVRTEESSPKFLEEHSEKSELIKFIKFDNKKEQAEFLLENVKKNLEEDELGYDDIVVINPDPLTTRDEVGPIRRMFFQNGINTHLAGVDTNPDIFFKTDFESITFTGIYRAKGNEAGMVYIINAQDCNTSHNLATIRNRLFTAITRSKAWVRVLGVGDGMQSLIDEYEKLRANNYELEFRYPTAEERKRMMLIHRDISSKEKKRLETYNKGMKRLLRDLEKGEIHPGQLDEEMREKLIKQLLNK